VICSGVAVAQALVKPEAGLTALIRPTAKLRSAGAVRSTIGS
jgi:hypothetical protein